MALNRFYLTENSIAQRSGLCIFISHQKRDADTAKKIADYFITSGIDVYFDEYDTKIDRTRPYSVVSAIKQVSETARTCYVFYPKMHWIQNGSLGKLDMDMIEQLL